MHFLDADKAFNSYDADFIRKLVLLKPNSYILLLFRVYSMSRNLLLTVVTYCLGDGRGLFKEPRSVYSNTQYNERILKSVCPSVSLFVCDANKKPTPSLLTVE